MEYRPLFWLWQVSSTLKSSTDPCADTAGSGNSPITNTTKGSCGPAHSTSCLGSKFGDCCSEYGYCGSTSEYCSVNNGCQTDFGSCIAEEISISVDGSCGKGKTCQGSVFGNCCSGHGYCGSTADYCSATGGCQSAFGSCS